MKEVIQEIIRFIVCAIVGTFLLWTGEMIITAVTLGWHRPKWGGYPNLAPFKRVITEFSVGAIGFSFWMVSIPVIVNIIENFKQA